MRIKWLIIVFMLVGGTLFFGHNEVNAQDMGKYQALYIYNFTKYIQWPGTETSLVIGTLGDGSINEELEKMVKMKGEGRLQYKKINKAEDIEGCNMIFITKSEEKKLAIVLEKTEGKSVLVVSESEVSAKQGAGISFYLDKDKLKFIVNKQVMEAKKIKVSSSLMQLAKVI